MGIDNATHIYLWDGIQITVTADNIFVIDCSLTNNVNIGTISRGPIEGNPKAGEDAELSEDDKQACRIMITHLERFNSAMHYISKGIEAMEDQDRIHEHFARHYPFSESFDELSIRVDTWAKKLIGNLHDESL